MCGCHTQGFLQSSSPGRALRTEALKPFQEKVKRWAFEAEACAILTIVPISARELITNIVIKILILRTHQFGRE